MYSNGIVDKVQAKMEKEEAEKEQIELAQKAMEAQRSAIIEAEVIEQNKKMQKRLAKEDALNQADVLISQIKKGNINS
jgi:hypothetical protein